MYQQELANKNNKLRIVEDECSLFRINSGQYETKLQNNQMEIMELQSAMASLHGELSVQQKELNELQHESIQIKESNLHFKKVTESQSNEIIKLQQEKELNDKDFIKLEQQLADTTAQLKAISYETKSRIESLIKEREELQNNLLKKETKYKQQMLTNQELNTMLGKIHNEMMTIREEGTMKEEEGMKRIIQQEERMKQLEEMVESKEKMNQQLNQINNELKHENETYISNYGIQKSKLDQLMNENKKLLKRCERLEEEKQEMLIEITTLVRGKEEKENQLNEKLNEIKNIENQLEGLKKQMKENEVLIREKDGEIRQLTHVTRENEEKIITLERQLNEEIQLKEQILDTSKIQNKENTTRIIELTTKNSKLTSDYTVLQEECQNVKKSLEMISQERDGFRNQYDEIQIKKNVMEKKIQELEDVQEENEAKLMSSESEIDELKGEIKKITENYEKELDMKSQQHLKSIEELGQKYEENLSELTLQHQQNKKQIEINNDKTIVKLKEGHQKQIEELQSHKNKEILDYKNRISSLGTAMEELQKELKQESIKNQSLMNEMDGLREIAENNGSELEERFIKQEKDRISERQRSESTVNELKEVIHQLNSQILQLQSTISTLQQEVQIEEDAKMKMSGSTKKMEEKYRALEGSSETLRGELIAIKKQLKENERKYASQMSVKEEEIQRITRRNEVLSEAVTRMTQMNNGTPITVPGVSGDDYGFQKHSTSNNNNGVLSYEQYNRQQSASNMSQSRSMNTLHNEGERSTIPDRIHDGRYMNPTEKPIVSPISHSSNSGVIGRGVTAPGPAQVSPLRRTQQGDASSNLEDDSQYHPPRLNAPSPLEPPGYQRSTITTAVNQSSPHTYSTKPALRSNSATVRTPVNSSGEYANPQTLSSQQIKSNYHSQKSLNSNDGDYGFPVASSTNGSANGSSSGGQLTNDEVNASLTRVQKAIESRRSNSTPRSGYSRATSAPSTSLSNLDGPKVTTRRGDSLTPNVIGATSPRSKNDPSIGESSLPIRAEYDPSYATSSKEIYQRDMFSPNRKNHFDNSEGLMSPSLSRKQKNPLMTNIPTLDMDDYHRFNSNNSPLGQVEEALPSHRSLNSIHSKESVGSGSGSGSGNFSQKIRNEVESGKDQHLPYSPQKSIRGNSHGLKYLGHDNTSLAGRDANNTPLRHKETSTTNTKSSNKEKHSSSTNSKHTATAATTPNTTTTPQRNPSPYLNSEKTLATRGTKKSK